MAVCLLVARHLLLTGHCSYQLSSNLAGNNSGLKFIKFCTDARPSGSSPCCQSQQAGGPACVGQKQPMMVQSYRQVVSSKSRHWGLRIKTCDSSLAHSDWLNLVGQADPACALNQPETGPFLTRYLVDVAIVRKKIQFAVAS